jgi:uncharacterized membrane protein HdeD (DUF308 family)
MKDSTKWILLGVVTGIFGLVVLGNAAVASVAIATLTGVMLLIGGAFQIVGGISAESTGNKIFTWITGALMVFLGWSFVANPLEGVLSLSFLILILLFVGGIVRVFFAFRMSGTRFFWPMLISGVLSLVLAAIVWGNPAATFQLLGILLGVEMLSNGLSMVFLGLFTRDSEA